MNITVKEILELDQINLTEEEDSIASFKTYLYIATLLKKENPHQYAIQNTLDQINQDYLLVKPFFEYQPKDLTEKDLVYKNYTFEFDFGKIPAFNFAFLENELKKKNIYTLYHILNTVMSFKGEVIDEKKYQKRYQELLEMDYITYFNLSSFFLLKKINSREIIKNYSNLSLKLEEQVKNTPKTAIDFLNALDSLQQSIPSQKGISKIISKLVHLVLKKYLVLLSYIIARKERKEWITRKITK
jgi:hypothetical protein